MSIKTTLEAIKFSLFRTLNRANASLEKMGEEPAANIDEVSDRLEIIAKTDKYAEGYKNGHAVGKAEGYTEGETKGKEQGYNEGYTEGETKGKEQGYNEGYTEGKKEDVTIEIEHDYKLSQCYLSNPHNVGDSLKTYSVWGLPYIVLGYKLPLGCKQINIPNAILGTSISMGEAKRCIVLVKGYTSEGGGTCAVATEDIVVTPETTGTKNDYVITVPEGLGIDGVYLGTTNIPLLSVTQKSEAYTNGYDNGYTEGYTKADNENPFYYIKDMGFRFSNRIFSAEKSNVVCKVLDCTSWNMAFGQLSGIKTLKIICDTKGLSVVWQGLVRESTDIELLDLTEFECYPTTIAYFAYCSDKLKTILGALDLSQCTVTTGAFAAKAIENVKFVPNTIKIAISFSSCANLTEETVDSIVDGLADLTGQTSQKVQFHTNILLKLTDAQFATIQAKNWTT